jgi:hypothetical protein
MYGKVIFPFETDHIDGKVTIRELKRSYLYTRTTAKEPVEKRIVKDGCSMELLPLEPINIPKFITQNLLIELKRTIVLPPKKNLTVYLRFPIEMGIIVRDGKKEKVIDIFTKNRPKYALYGDIKTGTLCRYYLSEVSTKPPKVDPFHEGVMEVQVRNPTNSWREMKKLVFQGALMKIFWSQDLVSMRSVARIIDDEKVETQFQERPMRKDQKPSYEVLTSKTLKLLTQKFLMEGGY